MHCLRQDWNKTNTDKLLLNDKHPDINYFQPRLPKNSSEVLQILSNGLAV